MATFSLLPVVKLIRGFENSQVKLPISAQKSFVLFARAATYRNFFKTFMKGLFLASSRRVLSLIDFKLGFGNPRHFVPRFSFRRPFASFPRVFFLLHYIPSTEFDVSWLNLFTRCTICQHKLANLPLPKARGNQFRSIPQFAMIARTPQLLNEKDEWR